MKIVSILVFIISCFCITVVYSQEEEVDTDQLDISGSERADRAEVSIPKEERLKTHVVLGTSFIYSPQNFYGPSYFIAPSLSYRVSPRFSLSAGLGFEYSSLYTIYDTPEEGNTLLPMTRYFLYTRGSYFLNERIMLSGGVYKSVNFVPSLTQYQQSYSSNYQGVDLGIQYQISRNISVGFHMRMNNINYTPAGLIPPDALVPVPGF